MTTERYHELEQEFKVIRDERGVAQNTAVRIGTAFLDLLRYCMLGEFDEIIFNKVLNKPKFLQGLITLGTIVLGDYAEGLKGGIITEEGVAELKDLWVREHAKLGDGQIHRDEAGRVIPALEVRGDSTFSGNLSSPEFVSAFLGGLGWAIQKKEFVNSAGEIEYKYTLEIDNAVIRNTLRVFEMIISQLLGENSNRAFSDMMEVDHYDPETGRVWLSTNGGRFYQCFRKDDCIMVQQYQPGNTVVEGGDGYITKSYELVITDVGTGGMKDENGDRLDWVTFKNFTSQMTAEGGSSYRPDLLIEKGDTFVRVDNLTDPERKGIVTLMTVGNNTPYMDVIYGLKTDPKHATKVRIGNLEGIKSDVFGWLESFGAYMENFYGVGKFVNAQTGEGITARTEMLLERFKTLYTETTYNISDDDNFVTNGYFQKDLEGWDICNVDGSEHNPDDEEDLIGVVEEEGGDINPILLNGEMVTARRKNIADMQTVSGIKVLHLRNMAIAQDFSLIKEKGLHEELASDDPDDTTILEVEDEMYMGIRILPLTKGTFRVRFLKSSGLSTGWDTELDESFTWYLMQAHDYVGNRWDFGGDGRMIISYTGECYIRFVAMTTDAVANSRYTFTTMFEQTARRITLEASRQDSNLNTAVANINLEYNRLSTTVSNNKSASDRAFELLTENLAAETLARQTEDNLFKATWVYQNDTLLSLMAAEFNADGTIKGYADLKVRVDAIGTTVTNNKSAADAAFASVTSSIDAETLARQNAVSSLADGLSEEAANRISGDSSLADGIAAETGAREAFEQLYYATWVYQNDHLLSLMAAQFTDEGEIIGYSDLKVRAEGISTTVTNNKSAADTAFASLTSSLDAETQARQNAVSSLAGDLSAETENRISGESSLQTSINNEAYYRSYWDDALSGNISTETTNRIDGDNSLAGSISAETANRIDGDNSLAGSINAEVSARQNFQNYYYGTWVYQNDYRLSLMAAQFDDYGNIKGFSDLQVQVNNISSTVTSNKTVTDQSINNLYSNYSYLDGRITSLRRYAEDIDEEQTASATWINQNANKWSVVAASFNNDGSVRSSGYVGLYVDSQMSNFSVKADNIDFTFSRKWSVRASGKGEVLALDTNGNLSLKGTIDSGSYIGVMGVNSSGLYASDNYSGNMVDINIGYMAVRNYDEDSNALSVFGGISLYQQYNGYFRTTIDFSPWDSQGSKLKIFGLPSWPGQSTAMGSRVYVDSSRYLRLG